MTVQTDDGVRLWASASGRGEPLVLCHGGPGLWDMFEDVAALLGDLATTVRWDQRGCGRSERCAGPWTTDRFVADLEAVRGHFGLERTALLGHSWGAQLALAHALAHPERVSALVYVAGTGIGPAADWHPAYAGNLRARIDEVPERLARWRDLTHRPQRTDEEDRERAVLQWSAEFMDRERALAQAERMAEPWFGINDECNKVLNLELGRTTGAPELYAACRSLEVPVLIVDGAGDIRPRSAVDSLERALPRVRRVILPGAGHLPWVEDPKGFREAVASALG
ncbi:alpha/beta fold hydrolase [Streptomyces viridochromogenes]|uniref:Putative Alpha/beta hydrolase fold protein n=1 Tax=Streptomyces viridochromogenes Tue57 TaxID=1160705 RepID=L8PJW9_STRVR|nr:alpha/beta hydrolase [Streptomyces viridochromogenes]ELS56750.1 putative Alpha/beta hydrolase fold protein [Streptomyces viridochromogenes Tue57]